MDSSFWLATINLGWSIVYIKGCQVITFLKSAFFSEASFDLNNQCNPDFVWYSLFVKYPLKGSSSTHLLKITYNTPDRRQSKRVLTIDEYGSELDKNSVFDCHLMPVGRQMAIENSVFNYF